MLSAPDSRPRPELISVMFCTGNIRCHLGNSSFVNDLTPHDAAGIGQTVARRRQFAFDVVNAFTEDNPDRINLLVGDDDLQDLLPFHLYLDLCIGHTFKSPELCQMAHELPACKAFNNLGHSQVPPGKC